MIRASARLHRSELDEVSSFIKEDDEMMLETVDFSGAFATVTVQLETEGAFERFDEITMMFDIDDLPPPTFMEKLRFLFT